MTSSLHKQSFNSEDHISGDVCLIVSVLTGRKKRRQLVEQLFTPNCIFPMCDNYSPWEYKSGMPHMSFREAETVSAVRREKSASADMPKAYSCLFFSEGRSIHIHI